MDTKTLLEDLADALSARVEGDRLRYELRGFPGQVSFVTADLLLLVVEAVPCHRLLITPETAVTKELGRLGIPHETSIGVPDFDERYVIKNAPEEKARTIMDEGFLRLLRDLEPFVEFDMGYRDYRLLKAVGEDYDTAAAERDLDALVQLVERTRVC